MKRRVFAILVAVTLILPLAAAPVNSATSAEIDQAISDGLAWLATQQYPDGRFGNGYVLADTAVALLAFENEGNFPGGGASYSPNVELGLDFVFQYCRTTSIGPQTHGNPDTNGNGQGIYFDQTGGETVYETGIVMQTIVASNTPTRVVATGPCDGMTYQQVMTDAVEWVAWAQIDDGPGRGGWRYGAYDNASANGDNSASQWPVLGLVAATQWGINAPQFVKDELNLWVTYIQNPDGGSGYDGPYSMVNMAKTGGLLVEFYYLGDDKNTPRAQLALGYINTHWADTPSGWDGNKGQPYAMFSVFKGLELMQVATIPNAPANADTPAGDWWGDYSDYLVNTQNVDGSWNGYYYWDTWLSTGWYIVILQATILPVSVSVEVSACACDGTGYDVDVTYTVERFAASGTVKVYEDDVLFATIALTDFQGSATQTYTIASDSPGPHDWQAIMDVIGGGIPAHAESSISTVNVCATPQVGGIPDQVTPFQPFDLDDYLIYSGGLPVMWSASGVPADWTVTIDGDNVVTVVAPAGASDPVDITFTASIECCTGVICSGSDTATFTPNRPPDCSKAAPSVSMLWPPNNKFVPITVLGVTDPDSDPVTIAITSIRQDEPVNTAGDGNFVPDGKGVGTPTAEVRAERVGTPKVPGNGRFYHIYFTASDPYNASCSGEVLVAVPHDQNKPPVDGGPLYDSTVP